jgi:Adenylate and Guanylate cyclase catalytic domain
MANECCLSVLDGVSRPETGDLCIRCGLHSGPVTAGVLRGEKSRFQLFGDTVNTASRMESTGQRNRIQISQSTADFLIEAGKDDIIQAREDLVNAKGKGQVQTYWIVSRSGSTHSSGRGGSTDDSTNTPTRGAYNTSDSFVNLVTRKKGASFRRDGSGMSSPISRRNVVSEGSRRSLLSSTHSHIWGKDNNFEDGFDEPAFGAGDMNRQERLIDWNVDVLTALLRQIIAQRKAKRTPTEDLNLTFHKEGTVLEEITEIIRLPQFAPDDTLVDLDHEEIELDELVESQLREYVTMVACMYRDNFFHNFEHASHVTMSAQASLIVFDSQAKH